MVYNMHTWIRSSLLVKLFWVLNTKFEVEVDATCGTHVHVSQEKKGSVQDLRNLARGILQLETQVETLLADRAGNLSCKNNICSEVLNPLKTEEKRQHIAMCQSKADVVLARSAGIKPGGDEDEEAPGSWL